ncbi:very-long-chain 3-oxoacyl-CoA reductase isoform X3 [Nilaparvata lugens]|uniref:very-long-chain 3-oxoacyl-CoA reductase isoform X3 n=2 Tax=Nilaparvata lugens TaxID=108931 RepID=UPI00193D3DC9|nr:very-long-chain 3-oxoacyl-CoA reductase isoform X3 [Nilaparvata lugens]
MWESSVWCALKVVLGLYLLYYLYRISKFIYEMWILPVWKKPIDLKSTGEWAVITGCTDGIGREYAIQLAKKGMHLILISRSESKLEEFQIYLSNEYNIKVRTIAVDFTNIKSSYKTVEEGVSGLDIGVLINNVGMLNGYKLFLQDDYQVMSDMVEVNVNGTVLMTSIILPHLVTKKKGVIINIGSYSSLVQTPHMVCYGATKKFILKFSEDLRREYANCGITIQCQTPSFIATKLSRIESPSIFVPTAEEYVASAMKTIGIHDVTCGYLVHDLMIATNRIGEETLPSFSDYLTSKYIDSIRKKSGH